MAVVPEAALGLWKIKGRNPSSGRFKTESLIYFITTSFTPLSVRKRRADMMITHLHCTKFSTKLSVGLPELAGLGGGRAQTPTLAGQLCGLGWSPLWSA